MKNRLVLFAIVFFSAILPQFSVFAGVGQTWPCNDPRLPGGWLCELRIDRCELPEYDRDGCDRLIPHPGDRVDRALNAIFLGGLGECRDQSGFWDAGPAFWYIVTVWNPDCTETIDPFTGEAIEAFRYETPMVASLFKLHGIPEGNEVKVIAEDGSSTLLEIKTGAGVRTGILVVETGSLNFQGKVSVFVDDVLIAEFTMNGAAEYDDQAETMWLLEGVTRECVDMTSTSPYCIRKPVGNTG